MIKLFCYVDESGQDTLGEVFVVSIVVAGGEYLELEKLCLKFEKESGKGRQKWHGANRERRLKFVSEVIKSEKFVAKLHYSIFTDISIHDFDFHTVVSIAETLHSKQTTGLISTEIYVDGLSKNKRPKYAIQLRKLGIKNSRIHRATDQGNALMRLADTLAGFVRDFYQNKDSESVKLFEKGVKNNTIVKN